MDWASFWIMGTCQKCINCHSRTNRQSSKWRKVLVSKRLIQESISLIFQVDLHFGAPMAVHDWTERCTAATPSRESRSRAPIHAAESETRLRQNKFSCGGEGNQMRLTAERLAVGNWASSPLATARTGFTLRWL